MVSYLWDNFFKKEQKGENVDSALRDCFVFKSLGARERRFVRDMVHIRYFRPGEHIFKHGEVGVGMYIVLKGQVDIIVDDVEKRTETPRLITQLESGDFFGEIALVENNGRRTASATAHSEATLIGFFKPDLEEIVARNPATGAKIMTQLAHILGRRLKETAGKVSELKQQIKKLR